MTFNEYANNPQSKKITVVEIDAPLEAEAWINYQLGIWFTRLTPGSQLVADDNGNTGYWQGQNTQYLNIQSLSVNGLLYSEVASIALCTATEKTWYYNEATTDFYIHFEDWQPPWFYNLIILGSALGFTNQIDNTVNNYYQDIYYEPRLDTVPNMSKKKDALFFGILQYQGGGISFDNRDGHFDNFSNLDLYGQPIRIKQAFEGLAFADQLLVYSGKVEDFSGDFNTFNVEVADIRKLLSRKYPINTFDATTYPDMDTKLIGTPIPIAYGEIINAPAYRTSAGNFTFCDTTFNAVDAGIEVINEDGVLTTHSGTETDGTFTIPEGTAVGAKTDSAGYSIGDSVITLSSNGSGTIVIGDSVTIGSGNSVYKITNGDPEVSNGGSITLSKGLNEAIATSETNIKIITSNYYVSFEVSTVTNGLDIISDMLENYENIDFNGTNYDTTEWAAEKVDVYDSGIWIGKGNLLSSVGVIEQICVDNNGIFDVLANGKFTFVTFDADKASSSEYLEDEIINMPTKIDDSEEYLSSLKVEYSKDWKTKEPELYTNSDSETEGYARYRQYKENTISTTLVNKTDVIALSAEIMEQSKLIKPKLDLLTKTQKIGVRILDNITYEYKRRNGKVIVNNALYQVLGVNLNMTDFEITTDIKYIKDV